MLLDISRQRKSSISITSLIDVIFILLFFFMLSSTFSRTNQLELNTAKGRAKQLQEVQVHKILLLSNDQLTLDGQLFSKESTELMAILQKIAGSDASVKLAVNGQVKVQLLLSFIDQLSSMGISKLNLSESVKP